MAALTPHRNTARVERADTSAPEPGSYWRLLEDLPHRRDLRGRHDALPAGLVLLIHEIEVADGAAHSVHLAPHPSWGKEARGVHMHIDDFLLRWQPAPDGDAVRAAEMAALLAEMQLTQQAMLEPPPPPPAARALLASEPRQNAGSDTGLELATPSGLAAITARAEALREDARTRADWITTHTDMLGQQAGALARFNCERGAAMLARTKAQLSDLDRIQRLVGNLELYTGVGVHTEWLTDGAPAPRDAPLHIYQDLLAFDEELLLLLDQDGIDARHGGEVAAALRDPALRQQLIPAPRGVVLVRFRAHPKDIDLSGARGVTEALQWAMARAELDEASMAVRMLYRDGERMCLIDAPAALAGIRQLMPDAAEQGEYFRRNFWGKPPERITPEDLDYAQAQRAQLAALDGYARALIVLWGLHDREGLCDASPIPRYSNWLDPAMQERHLRLVSHDTLIGAERPTFAAYREHHNGYLVEGSTVAVHVQALANEDTAPGCYASRGVYNPHAGRTERTQMYRFDDRVGIATVRRDGHALHIVLPATYCGYRRESKGNRRQVKLTLASSQHYLVLDRVVRAELDHYLGSRSERRDYAQYVELFRAARALVIARDELEAPLRAVLVQAAVDAHLARPDTDLGPAIGEALATVRAATRTPAVDVDRHRTRCLDALHSILTPPAARIAAAAALASAQGRRPLRLTHAGGARWRLYATPRAEELDPRLPAHPWRARLELRFGKDDAAHTDQTPDWVLLRPYPDERIVHDWEEHTPLHTPPKLDRTRLLGLFERIDAVGPGLMESPELIARALAAGAKAFRDSKRLVQRAWLLIPIGTAVVHAQERNPHAGRGEPAVLEHLRGPRILVGAIDAIAFAHAHGDAQARSEARRLSLQTYANKDAALRDLTDTPAWVPMLTDPERHLPADGPIASVALDAFGRPYGIEIERAHVGAPRPLGKEPMRYERITWLSPLGRRLYPHIAEQLDGRPVADAQGAR